MANDPDKFHIWLKLIERILHNNRDVIKEFNVILFNDKISWWKPTAVKNSRNHVEDFLKFADTLSLAGVSNSDMVLYKIMEKEKDVDIFLLSNGSANLYSVRPTVLLPETQVIFSYYSSPINNNSTPIGRSSPFPYVRHFNYDYRSVYFVANENEVEKASTVFRKSHWAITSLSTYHDGKPVSPIYKCLNDGQNLLISGTSSPFSEIRLVAYQNGKTINISIPKSQQINSSLAKRAIYQIYYNYFGVFEHLQDKYTTSEAKHLDTPTLQCIFEEKEADLLVAISWDKNHSHINLYITEPMDEVCSLNRTEPSINRQFRQHRNKQYNAEMYLLKKAKNGKYQIGVNYLNAANNRAFQQVKAYLTIYKNWGRKNEEVIKKEIKIEPYIDLLNNVMEIEIN